MNDHLAVPRPGTRERGTLSRALVVLLGLLFVLLPGTGSLSSSVPRDAAVREDVSAAPRLAQGQVRTSRSDDVRRAVTAAVHRDETGRAYGPGPALAPAGQATSWPSRRPYRIPGASPSPVAHVAVGAPRGRAPPAFLF